jgi:hypothetical protein
MDHSPRSIRKQYHAPMGLMVLYFTQNGAGHGVFWPMPLSRICCRCSRLAHRIGSGRDRFFRSWCKSCHDAAIACALAKGLRTADIKSEGSKIVSTSEMGRRSFGRCSGLLPADGYEATNP